MKPIQDLDGLQALAWPLARAEEALFELARRAGLLPAGEAWVDRGAWDGAQASQLSTAPRPGGGAGPSTEPGTPGEISDAAEHPTRGLGVRLEAAAQAADIDVESLQCSYREVETALGRCAPALLLWSAGSDAPRILALERGGPRPRLLGPGGALVRVDRALLARAWRAPFDGRVAGLVEPLVQGLNLPPARAARARRALFSEYLGSLPVGGAFALRAAPGRPLWFRARRAGLGRLLALFLLGNLGASLIGVFAWVPFARGALGSTLVPAWLLLWALLLLTSLPLRWLEGFAQALFGVRLGTLLRGRLMAGATRLDPRIVRGEGVGTLLGRAIDAEMLEGLLLSGGFVLLGALFDTGLAAWVLSLGPAPGQSLGLLLALVSLLLAASAVYLRRAQRLASARLACTQDLTERLFGLRTLLVQEPPHKRHQQEDLLLEALLAAQRRLDRVQVWLGGAVPMAWLAAAVWVLIVPLTDPNVERGRLALGLGGLLLGGQALGRLAQGLTQLAQCRVAWRQVEPLYTAAARREPVGLPHTELLSASAGTRSSTTSTPAKLVSVKCLGFTHPGALQPTLEGVTFDIHAGDRILLEGPSGGGKSTLISLLGGWRKPTVGSLEYCGLDRASWGAARWRAGIAAAPQFHENFVFGASFGFNLALSAPAERSIGDEPLLDALGQEGAARAEAKALEVCRELGLGPLLERMPAGLRQLLGETGWQLSHGEKSRLYLARALLSEAPVVLLDESLAALDPLTANQVLGTAARRAQALVLVAHT